MKMQFHKAVVKVLVVVAPDRTKTPVSLTFEDGKEYPIDRVCSRQRAAATKVGGTGIRYTIMMEEDRPISSKTKISGLLKQRTSMYRRYAIEISITQ